MSDFNVRSDSVNVEEIMRQVRARIQEKRGVDYTEEQIRELASAKLERFLDPQKVRSELLQQFRGGGSLPNYAFEDTTLFASSRPPIRWIRRLLLPILKLFFNPNPLIEALHIQADLNARHAQALELSYEVQHNLVLEITRLGIEAKNLKMRVESLSSRFDFAERRARSLEGIVQSHLDGRDEEPAPRSRGAQGGQAAAEDSEAPQQGGSAPQRDGEGSAEARRRRRRRRGRRSGANRGPEGAQGEGTNQPGAEGGSDEGGHDTLQFDDGPAGDAPSGQDSTPPRDPDAQ